MILGKACDLIDQHQKQLSDDAAATTASGDTSARKRSVTASVTSQKVNRGPGGAGDKGEGGKERKEEEEERKITRPDQKPLSGGQRKGSHVAERNRKEDLDAREVEGKVKGGEEGKSSSSVFLARGGHPSQRSSFPAEEQHRREIQIVNDQEVEKLLQDVKKESSKRQKKHSSPVNKAASRFDGEEEETHEDLDKTIENISPVKSIQR